MTVSTFYGCVCAITFDIKACDIIKNSGSIKKFYTNYLKTETICLKSNTKTNHHKMEVHFHVVDTVWISLVPDLSDTSKISNKNI